MLSIIFFLLSLILLNESSKGLHQRIVMSSKGFGKAKVSSSQDDKLKPTRAQDSKQMTGLFAKKMAKLALTFDRLKEEGLPVRNDVFARLEGDELFWFIGKAVYEEKISASEALSKVRPLVVEYAKSLRPNELAGHRAVGKELQIWVAPGNSEMDVARNAVALQHALCHSGSASRVGEVGFEAEVYMDGEAGFRCRRDNDGRPIKPAFEVPIKDPSFLNEE